MKTSFNGERWLLCVGIAVSIGTLLWAGMWPSLSLAAPSALPIRPTPFSATATPVPIPTSTPFEYKRAVSESTGAFIRLRVAPALPGLWTVVQWRDASGTWYFVDGWQGALEGDGTKRWWLPGTLFGYGPFRWVVYDNPDGRVVSMSDPFYLPSIMNMEMQVEILLSEAIQSSLASDGRLLQYRSYREFDR
jgi:hypothetical protein